ncbi:ATP-binding protein [Celerinatantimonas diazotrophica]|uniref:histidine kinase n=1 Tax=Celerinatantimonas diazotrophica TaxID=412034 RepID=A0A4R1J8H2_9GAMM|nr:ATP-binding protein [Celerinatantimonas diazotrophica]TCK46883.1 two-component system C4-dicarboxylate transport sensor histidine kinase DctB [Celerinatantimonas diazotrophica]CAG9295650.1 C4-dicarboxylate transport sensor protein DctB [Celerinatantimonas diazotrophica]
MGKSKKQFELLTLIRFGSYLALWLLVMLAVALTTSHQKRQQHQIELTAELNRMEQNIVQELARFTHLPRLGAAHPKLQQIENVIPHSKRSIELSKLLKKLNRLQGSDVTYLLNRKAQTIASSNYEQKDSFVGDNYAYRPYFQQAIRGEDGHYIALGSRSGKRGYYFSAPVYHAGQIVGVLVLKVRLSIIGSSWQYTNADYLVCDENGVIFYASRKYWLYHSLKTLPKDVQAKLLASRQYGKNHISAIASGKSSPNTLELYDAHGQLQRFQSVSQQLEQPKWKLYALLANQFPWQAVLRAELATFFIGLLVMLILHYWQNLRDRRLLLAKLNQQLEQKVAQRTRQLTNSNNQLKQALLRYQQTSQTLKQTEAELKQAAKLAMLGELSAGLNHELNQPLTAILTYAQNSQKLLTRNQLALVDDNLSQIVRAAGLMRDIIARFKIFARKSEPVTQLTAVKEVIKAAVTLLHNRFLRIGVLPQLELDDPLWVNVDPVQLEQVLINLLNNAIDALSSEYAPQIGIQSYQKDDTVYIKVWDNGCGLQDEQLDALFDPFYTTKKQGLGLGTTISQRIIEGFNGKLSAHQHPNGGACFVIQLPVASDR